MCSVHVHYTKRYLHSGQQDNVTAVRQGLGRCAPVRALQRDNVLPTPVFNNCNVLNITVFVISKSKIVVDTPST